MSKYDDIINCDYQGSKSIKKMSLQARAAQFAPFAALTGHNAAILETARSTTPMIELSHDEQYILSRKLNYAIYFLDERPHLSIEFFQRDEKKTGGNYVKVEGYIKRYIDYDKIIILSDNTIVNIDDIVSLEGEIFDNGFY